MKKVLLGTFGGFILFAAGLYAGYLAIESMRNGGSPFFILGSVLLCGGGMFVLYKAGRLDTFKSKIAPFVLPAKDGESMLEKNQEMVKEWSQANDKRDKLKMLEAAGRAEQEQ